ncbi:MAG TPA: hypothetical protein QF468_06875 [Nitrospinota bacterium]|nr:hypothetical protein [Nitrospinota bacterium]|tara:strand:+ start:326 stop:649 length:324 start_codon:yes stop_codon:yes gene_type:complete
MTILIELLLIMTVSAVVGYPLFVKVPRSMIGIRNINTNGLPHLLVQKEVAYATLKDLDFDFKTGKLSDEDYQELKTQYEKEAIGILEKIDQLSKKQSHPAGKRKRKP